MEACWAHRARRRNSALRRRSGVNAECKLFSKTNSRHIAAILTMWPITKPTCSVRFHHAIETAPDKFETWLTGLPTQKANDLRRKFPRENFQSDSDWVKAVQHEIASNLLPAARRLGPVEYFVGHSASVLFTDEAIEYDIGVEERIDAMIDKAIKRLVQTKAMKQMLGFSTIENRDQLKSKRPSNGKPNGSVSRDSHACTADSQHSKPRK